VRNDPRNEVLLCHNDQAQYGGENKAMDNRSAHDQPFSFDVPLLALNMHLLRFSQKKETNHTQYNDE
jgi:hypothetical protein